MNPFRFQSNTGDLADRVRWAREMGAFADPVGRTLMKGWSLGISDEITRRLVMERVERLERRFKQGEIPPFKPSRLGRGELVLGPDIHGQLSRLMLQWLKAGTLGVSNTGGGKSMLLFYLLLQIAAQGCPIWVTESYKQQLRRLRRALRLMEIALIIIRPHEWRWNLLQSHLRDPRTHLAMAVDLLMRLLALPPRARTILNLAVHALYRKFGIEDGNTKVWPTLFDLHLWVWGNTSLNPPARESILDRLGSLLVALTPRCAAWRQAWDPAELARFSIDFEMQGASETVKQVLLESTLFSLFQREVERGAVNGPLKLLIAFDDGQRFFDTGGQVADGALTPMDELAGVIRGTGIGLFVLLQTAQGLSRRLRPNLATKIIGRLGSAADYADLGADLGLMPEQIEWAKLHLQPGMFIGQVGEGDWREPFLFKVPLLKLPDSVSDAEAAESVRTLDALPVVAAEEFAHWTPHHFAEIVSQPGPTPEPLSEIELRLLRTVIQNPGQSSTFYARAAGINGKRAAEIRDRLIKAGYLKAHEVATKSRGRNAITLEPLEPAFKVVGADSGGGPN